MSLLGSLLGFLVLLVFGGMVLLVGLVLKFVMLMLVFWPYSVGLLVKRFVLS